MITERVLRFNYPYERAEEAEELKSVLERSNIEFICYMPNGYYPHEFMLRKSGKKWNDIYRIVNSVRSAKYKLDTAYLGYEDGKLIEYVSLPF